MNTENAKIAYFSMEIAIDSSIPTYSGGLGVLAGDTIRSAADLQVPMAAVTLLYRKGYFFQKLMPDGWQTEEPDRWVVEDFLTEMPERAELVLENRTVSIRCWRYEMKGTGEFSLPVYFLDTNLPENTEGDRTITDSLYAGDQYYRLCKEVVLGVGGVRMLRALGCHAIERFHMNEGHAALLTMELLKENMAASGMEHATMEAIDAVRKQCIFTTHTPVPAGHDKFPVDLVDRILAQNPLHDLPDIFCCEGLLNMTSLALNLSRYVNGVAKRHGEISRMMFAGYAIDAITNGVHAETWASSHFKALYDRHITSWRLDNFSLRYALSIPGEEIWEAHRNAKKELIRYVNRENNAGMDVDIFTIGFARRAATYKRANLIFKDIERLKSLSKNVGKIQMVFARTIGGSHTDCDASDWAGSCPVFQHHFDDGYRRGWILCVSRLCGYVSELPDLMSPLGTEARHESAGLPGKRCRTAHRRTLPCGKKMEIAR